LGVARRALVGHRLSQFIGAADQEIYHRHRHAIFATGQAQALELRMVNQDGTSFWAHLDIALAQDPVGAPLSRLALTDITELQRTKAILAMQEQLLEFPRKILAAREQERKEVASILHHDVGSLAVGLAAHLDALEADLHSAQPQAALQWLQRTRELFDVSLHRLKDVAVQLRPPELDVLDVRSALRQHFTQVTAQQGIGLQFRDTLGPRRLSGETATTLFRIGQEALTNALKHGHAQRVAVSLEASNTEVTLTVRDEGRGFDALAPRAPSTAALGLRLMREMATVAGGTFSVESQPRQGTVLRVTLPLDAPDKESAAGRLRDARPAPARHSDPGAVAQKEPGLGLRVFIADDHPVVRDGLRLTLERSGQAMVVVGEAADGLEVLEWVRTQPADVFILDITMPNLNGIETTRELLKQCPSARIIILSLHDTKAMVEESLAAGARGYLTKELAARNVVEAVTEVHAGRYYFCPQIAHFAAAAGLARLPKAARLRGAAVVALTAQERKVLQLIAEGHSNKGIADLLALSPNTVHAHRTSLMAKLNLHKQTDLVRYAVKAGLAKL
jgi:DNA-binding NarL/FixJ family response regulator/signal transduction histidine kinase